jgi:hypothetical protein
VTLVKNRRNLEALANTNCGWFYRRNADAFGVIPGSPIAYWAGDGLISSFEKGTFISRFASLQEGLKTSDNERFIRCWFEVSLRNTSIFKICHDSNWVPHCKGGLFRRWYGNQLDVLWYKNDGEELRALRSASLTGETNYFKSCISWNRISSDITGFRYYPDGFIPNMAGLALYPFNNSQFLYLLGLLNSSVVIEILNITNPTLNFPPGTVASLPCCDISSYAISDGYVQENIDISKLDWDSFEISWNFKKHPLV